MTVPTLRRVLVAAGIVVIGVLAGAPANAAPPPTPAPPPAPVADPSASRSLIPIPPGCTAPEPADVAFVGTAVAKDFEKVRYEIVEIRAGSATGSAIDGLLDVVYFGDVKFVDIGEDYLVGARFDETLGQMTSTVRPAEPLFGGNDVIGLNDTDIECPVIDDPVRTLRPDGSSVDSGVLSPLFDEPRKVLATLGVPTAIAFGVLIALVLLRSVWGVAFRGILELGRSAVTPTPDHRAVRTRAHRADEST